MNNIVNYVFLIILIIGSGVILTGLSLGVLYAGHHVLGSVKAIFGGRTSSNMGIKIIRKPLPAIAQMLGLMLLSSVITSLVWANVADIRTVAFALVLLWGATVTLLIQFGAAWKKSGYSVMVFLAIQSVAGTLAFWIAPKFPTVLGCLLFLLYLWGTIGQKDKLTHNDEVILDKVFQTPKWAILLRYILVIAGIAFLSWLLVLRVWHNI